jgi:hypothetical protein
VAFGGMLMFLNRNASAGGFANVQWRTVTAINFDRRPLGQHWQWRRSKVLKFLSAINNLPVNNCQDRFKAFDLFFRNGQIILRECDDIR